MRLDTVTLEKDDMNFFAGRIPSDVIRNTGEPGFFTIGAIDDAKRLLGLAQFCIGTVEKDHSEAGLNYLYVEEEERKRGVARTLLSDVLSILNQSGIKRILAFSEKDSDAYAFFGATGFENAGSSYRWKGKKLPVCWIRKTG